MKLHLYTFRMLLVGFVISAAVMIFIAMPGLAVGAVHRLGSVGMIAVLEFLPLATAAFVPYVLPVSLLLALVSTYGRLAALNEWTAIRMAGVNPYRMLLPAFALATLAAGGVYAMNAELLPRINVLRKTLRIDLIRGAFKNLSPGRTDIPLGDFYLSATFRDPDDPSSFYDCFIELPSEKTGGVKGFYADAVRIEFDERDMWVFLYGSRGAGRNVEGYVGELIVRVPQEELAGDKRDKVFDSPSYKTSEELLAEISGGVADPPRLRAHVYEFHQRIANAISCLMFVLVGCSTGVLMRKGTQLGALAAAIGYALVYWIFSLRIGKEIVAVGSVAPWIGAWGPLAVFGVLGVLLTRRAFRE